MREKLGDEVAWTLLPSQRPVHRRTADAALRQRLIDPQGDGLFDGWSQTYRLRA